MSKKTKNWLLTGFALILIGCILFASTMSTIGWSFMKLSTKKFETNNYILSEPFKNISIMADTADISFVPSKDSEISVVCYETETLRHHVTVEDGRLEIKPVDTRGWYEFIGIGFDTPKITVSLPAGEYGALSVTAATSDVNIPENFTFKTIDIALSTGDVTNHASSLENTIIKTSTGNIILEKLSAASLDLTVSTGRVTLSDITCDKLTSEGDTGKISIKNVVATEKMSIERSTGDVKFENCDAAEMFIETDTGDVKGSLLSDKVFVTKTDTGNINVPSTLSGGRCEITTDTGDINITIN